MARQVLESDIWTSKPAWWFKVWVYILSRVNYSDNGQFNRGENFFTLESIHHNCYLGKEGIKIKTVSNIIREMKLLHMLTTQKTTRGFIISVTNYDKYQDLTEYRNDTEKALLTTQKRHRNDTIIEQGKISKVSKEDKEGKVKHKPLSKEKPLEERLEDFTVEVMGFKDKYTTVMLESFIENWAETNLNGQMKWELELLKKNGTWETGRRLARWCTNQRSWHNEEHDLSKMASIPEKEWEEI